MLSYPLSLSLSLSILTCLALLLLCDLSWQVADPNVVSPNGRWLGVHGPVAHWTRSAALQRLTSREFERATIEAPPPKLPALPGLTLDLPSIEQETHQPAAAALYAPPEPPLSFVCKHWRDSFPRLSKFPRGYHDWRLCEPSDGGRQWKRLRRVYLGRWRRPMKIDDVLSDARV